MAGGHSGYCERKCGCPWQMHMHITCVYDKVKKSIMRKSTLQNVTIQNASIKANETVKDIQKTIDEYEAECKVIEEISSKFAYILNAHSNTVSALYKKVYFS